MIAKAESPDGDECENNIAARIRVVLVAIYKELNHESDGWEQEGEAPKGVDVAVVDFPLTVEEEQCVAQEHD